MERVKYNQTLVDDFRKEHTISTEYTDWDVWAMLRNNRINPVCACGNIIHARIKSNQRTTILGKYCCAECQHKYQPHDSRKGKGVPIPKDILEVSERLHYNKSKIAEYYCTTRIVVDRWCKERNIKSPITHNQIELYRVKVIRDNPNLCIADYKRLLNLKSGKSIYKLNEKYNLGIKTRFDTWVEDKCTTFELLNTNQDLFSRMDMHDIATKLNISYEYVKEYRKINNLPIYYRPATSNAEKELCEYIRNLGFDNAGSRKMTIDDKCYEIDVYIPELNIGFEYNGCYWHSDIILDKDYHKTKTTRFQEHGIHINHIWEYDWLHNQDLVKSMIKAKLGLTTRVYARKCTIASVSTTEAKQFLNVNHLKGYINSKYHIGLYYNDVLMMLCSFGKSRDKSSEWELLRMASLQGYTIVGGFSKLLNAFHNLTVCESVFSYVDRDISYGNSYLRCGFNILGYTVAGYCYVDKYDMKPISRHKFKKSKLIKDGYDSTLSEFEIVDSMNRYYRVWNSGNIKMIKYFR